jgi:hypothetical protein
MFAKGRAHDPCIPSVSFLLLFSVVQRPSHLFVLYKLGQSTLLQKEEKKDGLCPLILLYKSTMQKSSPILHEFGLNLF